MIDWVIESPIIILESIHHNVDPFFIAAIRKQENGDPGIEYGVEDPKANTYLLQCRECCASVRNDLYNYTMQLYLIKNYLYGERICYNQIFIEHFQRKWAPIGVANDPNNLNKFWLPNVLLFYNEICAQGKIA